MENLDNKLNKTQLLEKLKEAKNPEELAQAMHDFSVCIEKEVMKEARKQAIAIHDNDIKAQRGIRALTSEERKFYENMILAMKSGTPMQKLSDLDVILPETVITSVFEDLQSEHPLLEYIDFQSANASIEFIYNADGVELATWGTLTEKFKKELASGFKKLRMGEVKLSAFIPVSQSILDLGPEWLDRYVRTILSEAIFEGLEGGIIKGTGKDEPIGMIKDLKKPINPATGYVDKDAVVFKAFTAESYAPILKTLATSPRVDDHGVPRARAITKVMFIVNPEDYLTKVFPATTVKTVLGTFINDVFPFPTDVIQSAHMEKGKAVMGISKKYFFGLGTDKSGKTKFSDDVRFLEDERVYATKLYGNGTPKDNNAFVLLDISNLKVTLPKIVTKADE